MSSIKKALDDLATFQLKIQLVLDNIASSASGTTFSSAKPWEIENSCLSLRQSGVQLEKSLQKVEEHQRQERMLQDIRINIQNKTEQIKTLALFIQKQEFSLEKEIERANKLLGTTTTGTGGDSSDEITLQPSIPIDWVLQLARKLSYITSAPEGWHYKQGRPLPDKFHAPCPQMDQMKKSKLFKSPEQVLQQLLKQRGIENGGDGSVQNGHEAEDNVEWEEEEEGGEKESPPAKDGNGHSSKDETGAPSSKKMRLEDTSPGVSIL
jgi:hypothetical protein